MSNIEANSSHATDLLIGVATHVPPYSPLFVGSMLVAGGISYAAAKTYDKHYSENSNTYATPFGDPLLHDSVTSDVEAVKKQRLLPAKIATLGTAILVGSFISQPTYEEPIP
ncbi:hypothetical protein H7171_00680, partial [Candidatus Saccharibacteria bacterium]|nr:hypothetical protein [Candidatus Saccharibacteria bacterium]